MQKIISLTTFVFAFLIIQSCGIEEAKNDKNKLVIASDFLNPKDTILFKRFIKSTNISLSIIHLNAESIAKKLDDEGFNTNIDVVFVSSLQSVKKLRAIKFHTISSQNIEDNFPSIRKFQNNSWFAIGYDPYIISYIPDTIETATNYKDFTSKFSYASLNSQNNKVLKSHVNFLIKNTMKNEAWNINFDKRYTILISESDSVSTKQIYLFKWSEYLNNPKLTQNKKRKIDLNFNSENGGLYADRKCLSVVKEAKNFKNAVSFLIFLHTNSHNAIFLEKFGAVPILEKGKVYIYPKIQSMQIFKVNEDSLLMHL